MQMISTGVGMALSIRTHPQAVMRALMRDFDIVDEEDVLAFLERYPSTPALLGEIRDAIRRYFGDDRVGLGVFRDPEWPDDVKLVANVLTYATPRQALDRIDRFDEEWWLKKRRDLNSPVMVSFALQRRV